MFPSSIDRIPPRPPNNYNPRNSVQVIKKVLDLVHHRSLKHNRKTRKTEPISDAKKWMFKKNPKNSKQGNKTSFMLQTDLVHTTGPAKTLKLNINPEKNSKSMDLLKYPKYPNREIKHHLCYGWI